MRITRTLTLAGLVLAVGACEQDSQGLPFDVDSATTRTVPAEGGVVSSPAGAAIDLPNGALAGPLTVTVAPTSTPGAAEGSVASNAFSIEPAATVLNGTGELELKLSPDTSPDDAWLTTLVGFSGGVANEIPGGDVDLGAGILTTPIDRFGTYVAVVPPSSVVFPVQSGGPSLSVAAEAGSSFIGVTVDSVMVGCGAPGNRCTGVQTTVSGNLLDLVEDAALLYPVVAGDLKIGATSVTGSLTARGTLRVLLQSLRTALSVEIHALLEPTALTVATQTATELHLTNMRIRVSGGPSGGPAVEETADVTIPLTAASTGLVTVGRTFDIRVAGGVTQPASVAFTFPVNVYE